MNIYRKSKIKFIFFAILAFVLFSLAENSEAATIDAASCSQADVQVAINFSSDGDTVSVPAGNCNWDAAVAKINLNKSINLIGAGKENTNITITNALANYYEAILATAINFRISGFSFVTANYNLSAIHAQSTNWRIDNCRFTGFKWAIYAHGKPSLIDNNEFYGGGIQAPGEAGSMEWSADTALGTSNFLFIENNKFSNLGALVGVTRPILVYSGVRVVLRYNDILVENSSPTHGLHDMADIFDAHGYCHAETLNAGRSTRAYEIYNNKQTQTSESAAYGSDTCQDALHLRGGTGVIYRNQFGCNSYSRGAAVHLYDWRASAHDSTAGSSCSNTSERNPSSLYYCLSDIYRVRTNEAVAIPFSMPAAIVTGRTSGAYGTISGYSGGTPGYIYFLSITNGPFLSGEELQVNGVTKNTAAANSEAYSGEGYPCSDQIGTGKNQTREPLYVWSNLDKNNNPVIVNTSGMVAGYITENTDYFLSEKTGYSAYTCPHPLTGLAGSCNPDVTGTSGYNVESDTTSPAAPSGLTVN